MSPSHGLSRPRLPVPLGTERHADGAGSGAHCSIGHVRRFLTWAAGAAGGLAAYRAVTRRKAPEPVTAEVDPANELRAKLSEARAVETAPEEPDARRRDVHEQARAAIDEMRGGSET